jgi:hypothetical protein
VVAGLARRVSQNCLAAAGPPNLYSLSCRELRPSRKLARTIGNDKALGLFTEGFYRYSVLSSSLDVSNHHLNLLLALRFIFSLEIAWSLYAFSL